MKNKKNHFIKKKINKNQLKNKTKNNKKNNISNPKNTLNNSIDAQNNINPNDNNVVKIHSSFESSNFIYTKKLKYFLMIVSFIILFLILRIGYLQFIKGNSLKEKAYNQQVINQIISPKRGNIYDSTGKALAISAQVDTVTINPNKIVKGNDEETQAYKEKVAKGLSEIFELDYEETLKKVSSKSQVETIAKKVEKEKIDKLKNWKKENNISVGINIDEDSKRYYPYNNVCSNVIGFCGNDNQGLSGIESKWNSILTGTPGKIVSLKGSDQKEIPNAEESYISAENGSNLTLTIDLNIQSIIEKYLKQAVIDNDCKKGGNVIVMDPKTFDIKGMACYPDYNLNTPYTPNEKLAETYNSLSQTEKNEALYKMWSNKSVSETYEPGSVFKVITSAVALEENITTPDKVNDFICNGYELFEDSSQSEPVKIKCWRHFNPHGQQTLRQALCNSCNPAFMQLAKRIGASTLYKYYDAFGLFNSTNSGLYGEQSSIFQNLNNVGPVELATMSFGQRLNITPLQMATAISCIANDGVLLKPRIVKELTNVDTGAVTEMPITKIRQVVSKQTSKDLRSMMESVATVGTGKGVAIPGYSIGGKTGTSEPLYTKKEEGYVASYVAISPVEDTQLVLLLTLYDPPKDNHDGGRLAAPVVSQMLTEILPYLGVPSANSDNPSSNNDSTIVPDVRNKTVTEAQKILKDAGFNVKTYIKGDPNNLLVSDQTPKPGAYLSKNSLIVLYAEDNNIAISVKVPDLKGMNLSQAKNTLKNANLNYNVEGAGIVSSQEYPKDAQVPEGTIIKLNLKQNITDAH